MAKLIDITGRTIGRLTVVSRDYSRKGSAYWNCVCECGTKKSVRGADLNAGKILSCGCLHSEVFKKIVTKHGLRNTKEYKTWLGMRERCNNPNHAAYDNYGGRGIKVCDRWNDFNNFYNDVGEIKDGLSLDRIDNNAGYSPKNVKLSTRHEQVMNQRLRRGNTTGIKGVIKSGRGFSVFFIKEYLGQYSDFFEACCVRKSAEAKYARG